MCWFDQAGALGRLAVDFPTPLKTCASYAVTLPTFSTYFPRAVMFQNGRSVKTRTFSSLMLC